MSVVVVLLYIESCYVYPAWCRCRSRPCHSSTMGLLYSVHCQQNILGKFRLEPQTILNAQQPVTDKILIFNKIKIFHSAYLCTFRPRNNLNTQQAGQHIFSVLVFIKTKCCEGGSTRIFKHPSTARKSVHALCSTRIPVQYTVYRQK